MPPVKNSIDLQFANLVAAKIQSCYTILREMDTGAPTLPFAGGGDHSETTETRPDGETRTLTDIAPGFEIYGYKGEKLRGFVPTLPGLQFFEHSQMLLGILAVNLDLPLCVFLLDASERLAAGHQLKAPAVAEQFDCSIKTAQRDLTALRDEGKIEFVGAPRTGYYRLRRSREE